MDPALQELLDKRACEEVILRYGRTQDWLDDYGQNDCFWPDADVDYGFFKGTGEAFVSLFDATRNLEREQFQQELRLQSEFDGPFNFIVGGAYATDDLDFRAYSTVGLTGLFPTGGVDDRGFLNFYNLRNLTGDPGAGRVEQDRESLAFYFDGSIDFAERFRFTAGLRWTKDEKEFYKPTGGGGPCNQFTELFDARPADPNLPLDLATNCIDVGSGRVSRAGITGAEISQRHIPLPDSAYAFIVDTKKSWDELTWRGVLTSRSTTSR
ncbi:MAG: hypothetical protein R3E84_10585 [Pseudomonadales bacterium]